MSSHSVQSPAAYRGFHAVVYQNPAVYFTTHITYEGAVGAYADGEYQNVKFHGFPAFQHGGTAVKAFDAVAQ